MSKYKEIIESSSRVVVLTGAGVSTDSGIPDFQTVEENWKHDLDRASMVSLSYFQRNPVRFWSVYKELFGLSGDVSPNRFHYFLSALQNRCEVSIITQNVDGLHSLAGSQEVVELHGNRRFLKCSRLSCDTVLPWSDLSSLRCEKCRKYLRPDTVLFGEGVRGFDEAAALIDRCDLFIVAGTSLNVSPVSDLPYLVDGSSASSLWLNRDVPPEGYGFSDVFVGSLADFVDGFNKG